MEVSVPDILIHRVNSHRNLEEVLEMCHRHHLPLVARQEVQANFLKSDRNENRQSKLVHVNGLLQTHEIGQSNLVIISQIINILQGFEISQQGTSVILPLPLAMSPNHLKHKLFDLHCTYILS